MKAISVQLNSHLQEEVTTLCTCWKAVLTNGDIFGFTDHTSDLTFEGLLYKASTGYTPTAVTTNSALNVDNLDVQAILSDESITEGDLLAGLWDYAEVLIFQVNYQDLTQGPLELRRGWLGQVDSSRSSFNAELRGLTQKLQTSIGRVYAPTCDATLGDARCTVDLTPFTFAGTVQVVTSRRDFTDSALVNAAGYFDYGILTWLAGLNTGLQMEVKTFLAGNILLQLAMPYEVAIGDTFNVVAGCNKTKAHCKDKFINYINFRGFPDVPGLDQLFKPPR